MKVSELIVELQKFQNEHGDVDVITHGTSGIESDVVSAEAWCAFFNSTRVYCILHNVSWPAT